MTDLEDEVRAGLAQTAAAVTAPGRDVLAAARRRHHRRRALQGTALTTGTLSLAAVLAFGLASGGGAAPAPGGGAPVVLDMQTVAARVVEARDTPREGIRYMDMHTTLGDEATRLQVWEDKASHTRRQLGAKVAGAPLQEWVEQVTDDQRVGTRIEYGDKTWTRTVTDLPAGYVQYRTPPCDEQPAGEREEQCELTREALAGPQPKYAVAGTEDVDGRPALHLTETDDADPAHGLEYWVDADTYEIVRIRQAATWEDGREFVSRMDYRTLERTPDNLALLQPHIPDGFTEKPVPPFDPNAEPQG